MAKISVVVPVRNARPFLPGLRSQCESMAAGEHELEFVIVDDRSTDGGGDVLEEWRASDPRVVLIAGAGEGVAAARNLAVARASGDFVWFTDCDDEWSSTVVLDLVTVAERDGADVVVANARKTDPDGADLGLIVDADEASVRSGPESLRRLLDGQLQGHLWNKLVRRATLGTSPFPATRAHSDLGGLLGILGRTTTVSYLPTTVYTYKIRPGSILNSRAYRWQDLVDCNALAAAAGASVGIGPDDTAMARFRLTQVAVPLFHESVRRESVLTSEDVTAMRSTSRSMVTVRDALRLARSGDPRTAAKALFLRAAPGRYADSYRRYRARRYSGLDELT